MLIKVYGTGCSRCMQTEETVREAVRICRLPATVEKVANLKEMMLLGVVSLPVVTIDGKVVVSGRVPTRDEMLNLLGEATGCTCPEGCGCTCGR